MYQHRFILFIDILGFRSVISDTNHNSALAENLYKVLNSMKSDNIGLESFGSLNKEVIEASGDDFEEIAQTMAMANSAFRVDYPLNVTHFSDSLVISCDAANENTCFIIFDFIARLNYRLWQEYKILMRGGITVGKLIHEENGPLFGPAMVRAYDIESKIANFPRVLIDKAIVPPMKKSENYQRMQVLFDNAEDGYLEISLATSLSFLLQSIHSGHELMYNKYLLTMKEAAADLESIKASIVSNDEKSNNVKTKYEWLIEKFSKEYSQIASKISG